MMIFIKTLCGILLVTASYISNIQSRSFNNGLIFYNLENHNSYLPPTISVSRGRALTKFKYSSIGSIWSTFGKPCDCSGPLCGCCVGIQVKQYKFDQKMCANVTYARPKDEIQLEVFMNDTATAKYGIAARNPSPLCVPIMMGIPMSMCIQMSNIAVQGDNLNMCMDFLVRLASTELFEMHFQCMKVGLQGASWVGSDGQPVIPSNEAKIKNKNANESEDYYDESEAEQENKIMSKENDETNVETSMPKEDLNKGGEEMDYNDITEKIVDIVKENENQASEEAVEFVKDGQMVQDNKNVEKIVTNIMDSINKGNAAEDSSSELNANQVSFVFVKDYGENSVSAETEGNKITAEAFTPKDAVKHLQADGNKNATAGEKEMPDKVSNENQANEHIFNNKNSELGVAANQKTASEATSNNPGSAAKQQLDSLINANNIDVSNEIRNETETSSGYVMADNLKPIVSPNETTTSEISYTNNKNNSLTTATIMTTTTTIAATNVPSSIQKTDVIDTNNNEDDDQDENHENCDDYDDDDDDDGAGDNSHENDSDYTEEESEEVVDKITENEIQLNNNTSNFLPAVAKFNNSNVISHEASLTKYNQANESDSNESLSNNETNDVFETEYEEFEENVDGL